jgi:uncharacterized peroxidase-related enzyme
MERVKPLTREQVKDYPKSEAIIQIMEKNMSTVANSLLTMSMWPELLEAFTNLSRAVIFTPSEIPPSLKRLVAHVVSRSAGCQYCSAHSALSGSTVEDLSTEKIATAFEYETSNLFSDAERAALRVAQAAAHVPNAVTDEDFEELHKHFSDRQIVEIVSVIGVYGFLNRWNDTLATTLEPEPLELAQEILAPTGWQVGKHAKE